MFRFHLACERKCGFVRSLICIRKQSTSDPPHIPVLLHECVEGMGIESLPPGAVVVDGTFGAGGHSREILSTLIYSASWFTSPDH